MKLKKLSVAAVLAATQIASAVPAAAEAVNKDLPQETVTEDVYGEVKQLEAMEAAPAMAPGQLIFYFNSTKIEQDGNIYNAPQPMQVKKGVSYLPVRTLVDRLGFKLTYDKKTKQTIIIKDGTEIRFTTNSSSYTVNGVKKPMKGTSYQTKNTFMVPLTAITQALGIPYKVDNVKKRVILNQELKPTASFTVEPKVINAGDLVTYKTQSRSPKGLPIVDERWEGREDYFETPGKYIISYAVQDSSGAWSDPYTQTIEVLQPNLPPVAMFTTDKTEYKMGELITYTDQSTDDGVIESVKWENKELAFFTPGPHTVLLTVTDEGGLSSTYEKTIYITGETLYSKEEFGLLFTPPGEKFSFNGSTVPTLSKVPFTYTDEPSTLIRSNSPETVNTEGIVYRETAYGDIRFMVHHVNNMNKNVKMYVVATNTNSIPVTLSTENLGFAGPTPIATAAGKKSVLYYFESMQNGSKQSSITIQPGESKLILQELNKTRMKKGDVISLFADVYADEALQFDVMMIDENTDPIQSLPGLPILDRDGVHNRGTYPNSNRIIRYNELLGSTGQRLLLGDNQDDPNLSGTDPMIGEAASNAGNFGVLYRITLDRVAANTLISFNPRGGKYTGYAMVNGTIVPIYSNGQVSAPNEQAVLFRTGEFEQKVEILLTAAPGSNLPVNLLFTPIPPKK